MNDNPSNQLLQLVKQSVEQDAALRQKYEIGDKFRFVRESLNSLLEHLQNEAATAQVESDKKLRLTLEPDEVEVYVHLFNAKGLLLKNWNNMVLPNVFYEYSVNRPIYSEKSQIDSLIRSRANKLQHAYLAVAVKKADILTTQSQDASGNPLLKVKEGALRFEKLIAFTYNDHDYRVDEEGELIQM